MNSHIYTQAVFNGSTKTVHRKTVFLTNSAGTMEQP